MANMDPSKSDSVSVVPSSMSSRGGAKMDGLCQDNPVQNYCFQLMDISQDRTAKSAVNLQGYINSDLIPQLEKGTGRKVAKFTIGKSTSRLYKKDKTNTLIVAGNIGSRWRDYKKSVNYDGLVVLAALPKYEDESGERRALALEKALIKKFQDKDDKRLQNISFNEGNKSKEDMDIGIVYFAYKLKEEKEEANKSKPPTADIEGLDSRIANWNLNPNHCRTCKCITGQPKHCATCECNTGAEGGDNMGGGAKSDEGKVRVEEGGEDLVEEGGKGAVTGEEGGEGTGSLGVGPDDVSEVTRNLNVMKLK